MKWIISTLFIFPLAAMLHAALLSPRAKTAVSSGKTMTAVVAPVQWYLDWSYPSYWLGQVMFTVHQSTNLMTFQTIGMTTNLYYPISMTNPYAFYRVSVTWITPPP